MRRQPLTGCANLAVPKLVCVQNKRPQSDVRLNAARYRVERLDDAIDAESAASGITDDRPDVDHSRSSDEGDDHSDAGSPTMEQRADFVEISIAQAIRRGDFDDLPGAGKPLTGLGRTHDPNWWIRQKIERERLTGLGPPALTLRTEHAELDARLDRLGTEPEVREVLTDFNRRVVEARRQLQGGPPVVTPTRDIDTELHAWRSRRDARVQRALEARERDEAEWFRMSRRERRAARRAGRRSPGSHAS